VDKEKNQQEQKPAKDKEQF